MCLKKRRRKNFTLHNYFLHMVNTASRVWGLAHVPTSISVSHLQSNWNGLHRKDWGWNPIDWSRIGIAGRTNSFFALRFCLFGDFIYMGKLKSELHAYCLSLYLRCNWWNCCMMHVLCYLSEVKKAQNRIIRSHVLAVEVPVQMCIFKCANFQKCKYVVLKALQNWELNFSERLGFLWSHSTSLCSC